MTSLFPNKILVTITFALFSRLFVSAVTISGVGLLFDDSDHSAIKVHFQKKSVSAMTDSTITNANGMYDIELNAGLYDITFSKTGYDQLIYAEDYFIGNNEQLDSITLVKSVQVNGDQSGVWGDGIWKIVGDITVPSGDSLIISAGAKIRFEGQFRITVNGFLQTLGNQEQEVLFSSGQVNPQAGDWKNIRFNQNNSNGDFNYTTFEYGGYGTLIDISEANKVRIDHCKFYENGNTLMAIAGKSTVLRNSEFHGGTESKSSSLIYAEHFSNGVGMTVDSCLFHNVSVDVSESYNRLTFNLTHCNFIGDDWNDSKLFISGSTGAIHRNVFYNSHIHLFGFSTSETSFTHNNIFTSQFRLFDDIEDISMNQFVESDFQVDGSSDLTFNLFHNVNFYAGPNVANMNDELPSGFGNKLLVNNNGDSVDVYFNLFEDPFFMSTTPNEASFLQLTGSSPGINAGGDLINGNNDEDLGPFLYTGIINNVDFKIFEQATAFFPNPIKTGGTLIFAKEVNSGAILNQSGQTVRTFSQVKKLSLNELSPGLYFISFDGHIEKLYLK